MIGPESDKNPLHSAARFSPDFKKNAHKMNLTVKNFHLFSRLKLGENKNEHDHTSRGEKLT